MRALVLTVLIFFAITTLASAQTTPTMPPSDYPQPGTFCGLLELCPKAAIPKNDD